MPVEAYDNLGRQFPEFDRAARLCAATLIELAFAEDLGGDYPYLGVDQDAGRVGLAFDTSRPAPADITADATIPAHALGAARFVARSAGVVAGLPVLTMVARRFGLATFFQTLLDDGEHVEAGTVIATIAGPMRALLASERTGLNFLQRLSGVATLTAQFVDRVKGTKARVLDTRKTTPGWRALEKYAVRQGGGANHRLGLYDAVLIKDNHLAWLSYLGHDDPVVDAVNAARARVPAGTVVEVEVDTLDQFDRALECRPDIILVDNLGPAALAEAVRRRDAIAPAVMLEASGGVTLETVAALARTGVDRISVGALTHSAPALDIGLDFDRSGPE
jgi:nicotinate-nucleotide pyrophosphorylase (carboxylating)